jgi:hypothetical protein
MSEKFFSEAWTQEALKVERAAADDIYKRFKDPNSKTMVLAMSVADRPGVATNIEYVAGRSKAWSSQPFDEDRVWARFSADLDVWRSAAEGNAKASNLVMAGKIKLVKGELNEAVDNARAFDRLVETFGEVDTDWEI